MGISHWGIMSKNIMGYGVGKEGQHLLRASEVEQAARTQGVNAVANAAALVHWQP